MERLLDEALLGQGQPWEPVGELATEPRTWNSSAQRERERERDHSDVRGTQKKVARECSFPKMCRCAISSVPVAALNSFLTWISRPTVTSTIARADFSDGPIDAPR